MRAVLDDIERAGGLGAGCVEVDDAVFALPNATAVEFDSLNKKKHRHGAVLRKLKVQVQQPDQSLGLQTDESYSLRVAAPTALLRAKTVYGALHGLETLTQLVRGARGCALGDELGRRGRRRRKRRGVLIIQETLIRDEPRFPHRGLLIDSARHFLSLDTIKAHLDAMAASKLNVLHWHLTDDQSFPYGSEALPELPARGAFSAREVYSLKEIESVVAYARARGIRVVPEFDTPGHALSWGRGRPGLLTPCFDRAGAHALPGVFGPIDVTRPEAYGLVWALFQEAARVFPDAALHLGGDEVDPGCWESNPDVRRWMREHGSAHSAAALQQRWELRLQGLATALGKTPVLWEEAFYRGRGEGLDAHAVVQVWKWWRDGEAAEAATEEAAGVTQGAAQRQVLGSGSLWARNQTDYERLRVGPEDEAVWREMLDRVTASGHHAILSAPWYLNLGTFAGQDWRHYYESDPQSFRPTASSKQARPLGAEHECLELVLGGEACLWGEFVDDSNALERAWPAAAAVAERLWSPANSTQSVVEAEPRLAEHRCRLVRCGIPAAPIGPGSCFQQGPEASFLTASA